MTDLLHKHGKLTLGVTGAVLLLLLVLLVYAYTIITALKKDRSALESELSGARATISERDTKLAEHEATLSEIQEAYTRSEEEGDRLSKRLAEERDRNEEFEDQIESITGTVGKLDKLSKLDPELLMKYSKVYFLNEHYMPGTVKDIPSEFRFKQNETEQIDAEVYPFLMDLLEEAREDGIELFVVSAYRSYDEQKGLKNAYTVWYGSGANTFSADQGYSEHQLGTTVDFTTTAIGGGLTGFETTTAYTWLMENAHRFGFVLSYPKNNAYYIFEPWHWRFVGEDLADDLHDDGKYFYDLDQREIDTYLISIFD